jgi:preprotein translocase subunit YajC
MGCFAFAEALSSVALPLCPPLPDRRNVFLVKSASRPDVRLALRSSAERPTPKRQIATTVQTRKDLLMRIVFLRFLIGLTPVMLMATPIFADGPKSASPMSGIGSLLPMLLFMFLIIYFMMIRPEQRKQKERQKLISAMKKGDKVLTSAGIYGTVGNVKETTVMVKIADDTVVEFAKSAIQTIINNDGTEKLVQQGEKGEKEKK